MRKREGGQAFILVLILLGIGAMLVVPALQLTDTSLRSSQIVTRQNMGIYAAEAAQEKVMWMLFRGDLAQSLPLNETYSDTVDVCGVLVDYSITMRAVEFEGGVVLAGDHTIMPTKTVSPTSAYGASDEGPFTYTIALEQVSSNNTNGLDVVYDIMSSAFKGKVKDLYVLGSSYISDDGINWEWIDNPETNFNSNALLRWPAEGSFSSPFRDFTPGQVKYLKFQLSGPFNVGNPVACNWVVIQVGDIFTLSGPQAPLTIGDTTETECTDGTGVFEVTKSSDPTIIPPLVSTNITYTMTIVNLDNQPNFVTWIEDSLPPGFTYVSGSTSTSMTTPEENTGPHTPQLVTRNDVERYLLVWDDVQLGSEGYKIPEGANATLTFVAQAEQGVSGSYYNEVIVVPKNYPSPGAFTDIEGFDPLLYSETYSWNSGMVIVPSYDSSTGADGANISTNMGLTPDGVTILSWQFK